MIYLYSILAVYFAINLFFVIACGMFKTATKQALFRIFLVGLPAYIYWSWKKADEIARNKIKMHLVISIAIIVVILNLIDLWSI